MDRFIATTPTLNTFDFHGHQAAIYSDVRGHWVFVNQLCGFMGIAAAPQRRTIERNHWSEGWRTVTVLQLPGDSQSREHFLLHQRRLATWLGSITTSRIKDDSVRARVEEHQTEFADALADYLTKGVATNRRIIQTGTVEPTTVSWEQAAAIARIQHGLNVDTGELRDLLNKGGILTNTGRPHKKWEHLFWPLPTRWEIHASVLTQLIGFATKVRHELALAERDLQMSLPFPIASLARNELNGGAR
jgi:hypothetical protein